MKTVFFGSSSYVLPILEVLRKNFELALVVTTEKNPTDPIPIYCKQNLIPLLSVLQLNNRAIEQLKSTGAPLAILASFGLIIPKEVLEVFPKGILNLHPSLLPKYRGPTPVQTAILNADKETGVTIIKLDEEVDHGPIVAQEEEPVLQNDTSESLYSRLFQKGAKLLPKTVNEYINGSIVLREQGHTKAIFTRTLTRTDGYIDISDAISSERLDRMVRAYYPWPGVWTKWQMANPPAGRAGGKWQIVKLLPQQRLQVEGRKPMNYKDFLNGYPEAAKGILPIITNFK